MAATSAVPENPMLHANITAVCNKPIVHNLALCLMSYNALYRMIALTSAGHMTLKVLL